MSMTLIQTVTVGAGGAASIEFTGIPQDGTDLKLVVSSRDSGSFIERLLSMQINGDSSTYTSRLLRGDGSSVASVTFSAAAMRIAFITGNASTANTFGISEIYIPNYTATGNKSISAETVSENKATTAHQAITAGQWSGSGAVTSLQLLLTLFMEHSTASLYKITKA